MFFIHFRCWSPLGAKMGPRPLQEASRIDFGSILNGFYTNFGQILDDFWSDFRWFFNDFGNVSYYFGHQPNQVMNQTNHQSINQSPYIPMHTARPITHSVTLSLCNWINQPLIHWVTESLNPSVTQSLTHSVTQSLSHSAKNLSETEKQMDGNYIGKYMKPTTNHPTSQCIQHV